MWNFSLFDESNSPFIAQNTSSLMAALWPRNERRTSSLWLAFYGSNISCGEETWSRDKNVCCTYNWRRTRLIPSLFKDNDAVRILVWRDHHLSLLFSQHSSMFQSGAPRGPDVHLKRMLAPGPGPMCYCALITSSLWVSLAIFPHCSFLTQKAGWCPGSSDGFVYTRPHLKEGASLTYCFPANPSKTLYLKTELMDHHHMARG